MAAERVEPSPFRALAVRPGCEFQPDVVVGWNFVSYAPAYSVACELKVPAVAWYSDVWLGRWERVVGRWMGVLGERLEQRALRSTWRAVVANSGATRDVLRIARVREERIVVIPPGVSLPATPARHPSARAEARFVGVPPHAFTSVPSRAIENAVSIIAARGHAASAAVDRESRATDLTQENARVLHASNAVAEGG